MIFGQELKSQNFIFCCFGPKLAIFEDGEKKVGLIAWNNFSFLKFIVSHSKLDIKAIKPICFNGWSHLKCVKHEFPYITEGAKLTVSKLDLILLGLIILSGIIDQFSLIYEININFWPSGLINLSSEGHWNPSEWKVNAK